MKTKRDTSTVRRILGCALVHKYYLFGGLIAVMIGTALSMIAPILVGRAVDGVVYGGTDFALVARYCVVAAACVTASGVLVWLGNVLLSVLAYLTARDVRVALFRKLLSVPMPAVEKYSRGDLMMRMSTFGENLTDGLYQGVLQLSAGAVTLLVTVVCMYTLNWAMATIIVCLTPVSAFVAAWIARKNRTTFARQSENMGRMSGTAEEFIAGTRVLRAYGRVSDSEEVIEKLNRDLFKSGLASQYAGAQVNPVSRIVNNVVYAVVTVAGGLFIIGSGAEGWATAAGAALTVGALSAFLTYANQFARPFNDVTSVTAELQTASAAGKKIFEIMDIPDEDKGGAAPLELPVDGIVFDDVAFSYTPERPFIEGMTFRADKGRKVAIVGTTGSGKTTVINLIMRFYDITGGRLTMGGRDASDYARADVRKAFGMVLQDTWLFSGMVRENIAYGKPDATEEEIREAARAAHLDKFISTLAHGYDTVISAEGEELSEGQKQLITIARVFLARPDMLILDEATASVDAMTERAVQAAFAEICRGKTTFVVAHRLSTIRDSDLILVMDGGRIVEQGDHETLVREKGLYYRMLRAAQG